MKPNRPALEALITKPEVERKLLIRLQKKAETYAQDFASDGTTQLANGAVNGASKIDVAGVVELYESFIIPLTKEVEVNLFVICGTYPVLICSQVDYLLQRLVGLSDAEIDTLAKKGGNSS